MHAIVNRTDTISLSDLTDQDAPSVREAIDSLEGVEDVTTEGSGELTVTYDDDVVSLDSIKRAIEEQGDTPASY
jgi:copper chaperone CopZ